MAKRSRADSPPRTRPSPLPLTSSYSTAVSRTPATESVRARHALIRPKPKPPAREGLMASIPSEEETTRAMMPRLVICGQRLATNAHSAATSGADMLVPCQLS